MRVYVVGICSFLVAFAVSQAADVAKPAANAAPTKPAAIDAPISREAVLSFLNGYNKVFIEGYKGKPAESIRYFAAASMAKNWLNFRFLEVDTEIDKSWFERVYKMLDYLNKTKDYIELAKVNGKANTDEYKKVLNNFNEVSKRFPELLNKPTPVEKNKLEKLREEKRKWEVNQKYEKSKKNGSIKEND